RSEPVTGDFNADHRTDLGVFYDYGRQTDGNYRTGLWSFTSDGTAFTDPARIWDSNDIAD
uniref:hypothetical protein n=1 Tax=Streptomyces sp. bgisy154 TaxID=3413794 RepID=UPI003D73D561